MREGSGLIKGESSRGVSGRFRDLLWRLVVGWDKKEKGLREILVFFCFSNVVLDMLGLKCLLDIRREMVINFRGKFRVVI